LGELVERDPAFAESLGFGVFWQERQKCLKELQMRRVTHDNSNQHEDIELLDSSVFGNTAPIAIKEEPKDQSEESGNEDKASNVIELPAPGSAIVTSSRNRENLLQILDVNNHQDIEEVHVSDGLGSANGAVVIFAKEKATNLPSTRGESNPSTSFNASTSSGHVSSAPQVNIGLAMPSR